MANEANISIGVKDKTARGSASVISAFKRISKEAKTTSKQTGRLGSAFQSASSKMRGLTSGLVGKMGVVGAFAAVGAAAAKAAKEALAFTTAVAELSTLLPAGSKEVGKMADAAKDLARQFGDAPLNQTKAFYQIISAGAADAAEATSILTTANKLAIGGVTDVTTAADGLTSVLNAYGLEAKDSTRVSDAMFVAMRAGKTTISELANNIGSVAPLAAQTGASFEQLFSAVAALTKGGQSTSVAMTGVRAILAAIVKPTEEARTVAKDLGLNFTSAALASRGFAGMMADVAEKTGGSSDKMALLFGGVEALVPAMALTGKAAGDFNSVIDDMKKKAGSTDEALEKMMSTPQKQLDIFMAHMETATVAFGESILGAVAPVLTALNAVLKAESDIIKLDLSKMPTGPNPLIGGPDINPGRRNEAGGTEGFTNLGGFKIGGGGLGADFKERLAQGTQTQAVGGGTGGFTAIKTEVTGETSKSPEEIAEKLVTALREAAFATHAGPLSQTSDDATLQAMQTPMGKGSLGAMPDFAELTSAIDLDLATPWLDSIKKLGERSAALLDEQGDFEIEQMRAEKASEVDIVTKTASERMAQLDRTQAAEKKDLLGKGVLLSEINKVHKGEKDLTKARSDLKIKTATLTQTETELTEATQKAKDDFEAFAAAMEQAGKIGAMVGPKTAAAFDTANSMISGFAAGGPLGAAVAGFTALPGLLGHTAEAAAEFQRKMQKLNDELMRGKDKANNVIDTLFGGDTKARQNDVFEIFEEWFEFFRGPEFKGGTGGYKGGEGTDETIRGTLQEREALAAREVFDRLARADALGTQGLAESAKLYDFAGKNAAEFRAQIDDAFGSDSTLGEVGDLFFETSSAFDHLRESTEEVTAAVTQLSEAEKAAVHARFAGEAQQASTRLQAKFSRAKGDVFEQAAAFEAYQAEIVAILEAARSGGAGSGAGGAASSDTAAAARANAPITVTGDSVEAAVNVSAQVIIDRRDISVNELVGMPSPNAWENFWRVQLLDPASAPVEDVTRQLDANIAAHKKFYVPHRFIGLPTVDAFDGFWSRELLGPASEPIADKAKQIGENIDAHQLLTVPAKFIALPLPDAWDSFWSRDLLGVATTHVGSKLTQVRANINDERDKRVYHAADFLTMPLASSFENLYTHKLLPVMSGDGELGKKLTMHWQNTQRERDSRVYYAADFLKMPAATSFADFYGSNLQPRMLGDGELGKKLEQHRLNIRDERDERVQYVGGDFLKMPDADGGSGTFADYYSKELQPRMLGGGQLGATLLMNQTNIQNERDKRVHYTASDFLKMPSAGGGVGGFADYYSTSLQPRMLGDGKLGQVLVQVRKGIHNERDQRNFSVAADFITLPTQEDFASHLMPLQRLIRNALQQVVSTMNKVSINATDFIEFDTSGIQDSIARVVQDATDDRQFDTQFESQGYSGGRA